MKEHQRDYYSGHAWANEIAKKGYVVLVSDAFPFASRRVMMQDVPEHLREGLNDEKPEDSKNIEAYNKWAGNHEHIWLNHYSVQGQPGREYSLLKNRMALNILCARKDVDKEKIGCGGLSGGGMRTVFYGWNGSKDKMCCMCWIYDNLERFSPQ